MSAEPIEDMELRVHRVGAQERLAVTGGRQFFQREQFRVVQQPAHPFQQCLNAFGSRLVVLNPVVVGGAQAERSVVHGQQPGGSIDDHVRQLS